jgi:methylmalonyl-CoA mutase cobalamin-binding domain/chain
VTSPQIDLQQLIPDDLPDGNDLVREAKRRAEGIPVGRSRAVEERNGKSDREFKERCRDSGQLTTYINLGYKTWAETRDALHEITAAGVKRGYKLDRVSLVTDRRMGLPPEMRDGAIAETGLMMYTDADWEGATRDTDVEPEWNDHGVATPGGLSTTEAAIRAGFGYIGDFAEFNRYSYPGWDDDAEQMIRGVQAAAMIAQKRDHGVVLNSFIEDGFCSSFHDLATSLGWSMFQCYIAENLIGAAHAQSFGSTFSDPIRKQAFGMALDSINVDRVPPTFVHGDTNALVGDDFDRNAVIVAADVMYTIARELKHPTGAAMHATPVSEPIRIPTVDELVESLVIVSEAEKRVRACPDIIDWRPIYQMRDLIIKGGRQVFRNLLEGLGKIGVNTRDPLQLMLATRRLGASAIEDLFHAGEPDSSYPRGFKPIVASDTLARLQERRNSVLTSLRADGRLPDLRDVKVVTGGTDVHEYALHVLTQALSACGAKVIDLGINTTSPDIAKVVVETAADSVAVSTHNGMALTLGRRLKKELDARGVNPRVFMGGRLNEDLEHQEAADVRPMLRAEGIVPCDTVEEMIEHLRRKPTDTGVQIPPTMR